MNPDEYVKKEKEYFDHKAKVNKSLYYTFSIAKILLTISITVLSSIFVNGGITSIIIAIISGLATLAESLLFLFKSNEKWIMYRSASEAMQRNELLFKSKSGEYGNLSEDEAKRKYYENIQMIFDCCNESWNTMEKASGKGIHNA